MRKRPAKALFAVLPALLALWGAGALSIPAQTLPSDTAFEAPASPNLVPMVFRIDLEEGWNHPTSPGLSRAEIIRHLKDRVAEGAGPLWEILRSGEIQGLVARPRIIWIAGVVVADVSPDFLSRLKTVSGLLEIRPDTPLVLDAEDQGTGKNLSKAAVTTALQKMNVPEVWAQGFTGKNILIASIDSGVTSTHPDLAGQIWTNPGEVDDDLDNDGNGFIDDLNGWNFAGNNSDTSDANGHGTLVAGLAIGDGTLGTRTGGAPDARLMILRLGSSESTMWEASQYAVDMGARVILQAASWKWSTVPRSDYPTWRTVTQNELAAGVIRINSSGNMGELTGDNPIPYNVNSPANCPSPWLHPAQTLLGGLGSVIAAANVDLGSDVIFPTSAQGPSEWVDIQTEVDPGYPHVMPPEFRDYPYEPGISQGLLKPDLAAYGQGSTSTSSSGGYSFLHGTSAATGHLAGITALLLEARPSATPAMLAEALFRGAIDKGPPGWDPRYGEGLVNAQNSLNLILQPCLGAGDDLDLDGICGGVDNCPLVSNSDQANQDTDAHGDSCDNCPLDENGGQEDGDSDGLGDVCDCAPDDGDIFGPPSEINSQMVFESDGVTLTWMPQPEAQTYNVYKGRIPAGTGFGYRHTCHRLDLDLSTVVDVSHPGAGEAFYYLAQSANCFGNGTLGEASGGAPRPDPLACSDQDLDEVSDTLDNCRETPNPDQADANFNGIGDLCESFPLSSASAPLPSNPGRMVSPLLLGGEDDGDDDGVPDSEDNCPLVFNPPQKDDDADGRGDDCDCAPFDSRIFDRPTEIEPTLFIQSDGRTLIWSGAPDAEAYSVFKGRIPPGRIFSLALTCHEPSITRLWSLDAAHPPAGGLDYYLVAGENCFGRGPSGFSSAGVPAPDPDGCPDADDDEVRDAVDNCPEDFNWGQADSDFDGSGDSCDLCPRDRANDGDADGACGEVDNCPGLANPGQEDLDGDSVGDVCDPDDDADGWLDQVDNCPRIENPAQQDTDADGLGEVCDPCPLDAHNDQDQDGRCAEVDNCPLHSNPTQADEDMDGWGDPCDICPHDAANDDDQDGACGDVDNCPGLTNPGQGDLDSDGRGDSCDCAPEDGGVFQVPAEAGTGLRFEADRHTLIWNDVSDAQSWNVFKGRILAGEVFEFRHGCFALGVTQPSIADISHPGRGSLFYYLVQVENCFGVSGIGHSSGGASRPVPSVCPDPDLDGLADLADNCPETANTGQSDLDWDDFGDACDICPNDPANDDDADGACGDVDNCPGLANPGQADADSDGAGDLCDPCPQDDQDDGDHDGWCADQDNCPVDFNPGQEDLDSDGTGDSCDPTDTDEDGVPDARDNCRFDANSDQADLDGDNTGDVCDPDRDGDGFADISDNCPLSFNPGQEDQDGDSTGNLCDPDIDGDLVANAEDNCPWVVNADQADFEGDGTGDLCDSDRDGDGAEDSVDNCPSAWNPGQEDADEDDTGDTCEDEGIPQIAVVKWPQAQGVWLVGTPFEKTGNLLNSRWRISTADGADFDANVIWEVTLNQLPLTEVRVLFDQPLESGLLFARVAYRDSTGWSAESSTRSWNAVALPADDGHLGARPGTIEFSDTFDGPNCSQPARPDNLDRRGLFWPGSLAEPSLGGEYFTLGGRAAVAPLNSSYASAQTALVTQKPNAFITALMRPAPPGQNAYFDFSFGVRASGTGTNHQSYRCKVERLTDRDTIHFNKFYQGVKGKNMAIWNGNLGNEPWRVRCEAVTIGAQGNAVRLSAYLWNGSSWDLVTTFVDNGSSGEISWDSTPRILTRGGVVVSHEKAGQARFEEIQAGSIGSAPSPKN